MREEVYRMERVTYCEQGVALLENFSMTIWAGEILGLVPVNHLGLSALVEVHNEAEGEMALRAGARIIGVNNRNLKDFSVDPDNSRRLRALIPREVLFVSESGVRSAGDIAVLRELGADGVLIGETLMRAADKKSALAELRGGI